MIKHFYFGACFTALPEDVWSELNGRCGVCVCFWLAEHRLLQMPKRERKKDLTEPWPATTEQKAVFVAVLVSDSA